MKRKRILLPLLILVALGATAYGYFAFFQKADDPNLIPISGNIEVTDVEVSFRMSGWVEARPVSEGETIGQGDVVARLESTELTQEVALRAAEVAAYQAELDVLVAGSRPQEIAAAQAAVARAQAEVERAKLEFGRQKDLFERKLASEQTFVAARSTHEAAVATLREAREQLELVREGPRQEEINRARARLDQAKQSLALAQTRLGYATLGAPLSGVVLSENVEPGEYVVPGVPVVTIGDLVHTWVRAYVDETDLGRVKLGQPVCVTTDTYPDKVYPGNLTFIAADAEFTPKNVQTTEERVKLVYRVKIEIANPAMELKPGMPADAAIWVGQGRAQGLSRRFGDLTAVADLTLSVEEGEIFGLVGPDGAGKTTVMRLLTGILEPSAGDGWVAGHHVGHQAETVKENIAYMSQRFGLYADLTVMENIGFYADIYGAARRGRARRVEELLAFSNLTPFKRRQAGKLSGGMKQKLGLACALVHTPKVLFLDEPTNGVDPVSRRDFWRILYQLLREKVTIFVSTAYLDEAERCARVAFMNKGHILAVGTPAEVKELMRGTLIEVLTPDARTAVTILRETIDAQSVGLFGDRIHIVASDPNRAINDAEAALTDAGLQVVSIRASEPSLEDVFVSVLAEEGDGGHA